MWRYDIAVGISTLLKTDWANLEYNSFITLLWLAGAAFLLHLVGKMHWRWSVEKMLNNWMQRIKKQWAEGEMLTQGKSNVLNKNPLESANVLFYEWRRRLYIEHLPCTVWQNASTCICFTGIVNRIISVFVQWRLKDGKTRAWSDWRWRRQPIFTEGYRT